MNILKPYNRIFKEDLISLFESTYHLRLNENRELKLTELYEIKDYLTGKENNFLILYKKLVIFIQENQHIDFSTEDISFILHTPGMISRAGQSIFRGMILPASGKYLKWQINETITLTPKKEYVSYSLDKKIAESFAFGGKDSKIWFGFDSEDNFTAEQNLRDMKNKYSKTIHIVLESKCPKFYLSFYDFLNSIYQYYKFTTKTMKNKSFIPIGIESLFNEFADWDREVLVFKSIPTKIIDLKTS